MSATPSPVTVADLVQRVNGPVLGPDDPAVAGELFGFNVAARHTPALVVGATSAQDVAHAVRYAASHDLAVSILATGHTGTPRSGVVITTRRMTEVSVDPVAGTARVAAGAVWQQVLDAATPHGLAPLNGSSPQVGVVGYTLGGGLGPLLRSYGAATDHVLSIEVVTADGEIRTVGPDSDPDLFSALLGGGKGSFGVVTALEFRLMPVARLYGGGIFYAGEHAAQVLHAYREWSANLSEATTTSVALLRLPPLPEIPEPLRGRCSVHLRFAHLGPEHEGRDVIAPMRAAAPALMDSVAEMPYSAIAAVHTDPTEPMPSWTQGAFLDELTAETVDTLLSVAGPQAELPLPLVELRQLGGAFSREPAHRDAVSGRNAAFILDVIGLLPDELRQVVPGLSDKILAALAPWTGRQNPVNFFDDVASPEQTARFWDEKTYERLKDVKRRYDPQNVFRGPFSVPAA
ncbi:FAD-binding oxidoreductase [Streptomyces sp. ODS05-4]|uniref:FAD-binding oxidoreductase n=1 Tax=Streptomyces sp. ODS05-4 TaxID=2944939 RepID=UPI00210D7DB9|nr:FAD-binding oxidoreductase [Streptomyces sp. ODS05-4]